MASFVECCHHNADEDVRSRLQTATAETDVTVEFRPCLQRCGPCFEKPFLVVDGELRTGSSHESLVDVAEFASCDEPDADDCTASTADDGLGGGDDSW